KPFTAKILQNIDIIKMYYFKNIFNTSTYITIAPAFLTTPLCPFKIIELSRSMPKQAFRYRVLVNIPINRYNITLKSKFQY
ncbi:MAG: hypothetical protein RSA24_05660, partial [Clostridia bacterium]